MIDQLHRTLKFKETPKRIVSLVPSQTELLCDLGLKDSIVGVTKFCIHPQNIKTDAVVIGGTKQIHIDRIKKLNPDIILCNKEENTKVIVEACEQICTVHVSDIFNIDDSLELIQHYGEIFSKKEEASELIQNIKKEVEDFQIFIQNKPTLKVAYFIWKNPWMVAANHTFIHYLLQLNKFDNVYKDQVRYPEVELSNAKFKRDVDVVLLPSEPFPFKEVHIKETQEVLPNTTVILVDGEMFSWFGSRLLKAFKYFKMLRSNLENKPLS